MPSLNNIFYLVFYVATTMGVICIVNSTVKGHHVYKRKHSVGDKLQCILEPENRHSDTAIVVKTKLLQTVGHVPEGLCQPLFELWHAEKITEVECIVTGPPKGSDGGVWRRGGGVDIPCKFIIIGDARFKKEVKFKLKKTIMKLRV